MPQQAGESDSTAAVSDAKPWLLAVLLLVIGFARVRLAPLAARFCL
jgi:hypothetical protein